jgi:2-polyprenyl-6-methoxyphenol hydroxylase-like FAD-dependent oxidoreductase
MSSPRRRKHAEIAGAGLGGLTVATALAHRGWSVRVHERAAHLRDIGVGTTLWQNGHLALDAVGALEEVTNAGTRISRQIVRDERMQPLRVHDFNDTDDRALVVLRVDHHRALVNTATKAGVEIITSSTAVGADPDGTLIMENGDRHRADLVIGCDGYNSKVRDSLGLAKFVGFVTEARIGRVTIPRDERPETEMIQNFWNGPRRCGLLGCQDVNYIYLSAPENCPHNVEEVRTRSLNKPVWIEAFPFLKDKWEMVESEIIWGRYPISECHSWSSGRAAILGDSAHSMPPTMAQGAGCAMANGVALAEALKNKDDVPAALEEWEARERPVTDVTQRWAVLSIMMSVRWPENLLDMRSQVIAEAFTSPALAAHYYSASRHVVAVN